MKDQFDPEDAWKIKITGIFIKDNTILRGYKRVLKLQRVKRLWYNIKSN